MIETSLMSDLYTARADLFLAVCALILLVVGVSIKDRTAALYRVSVGGVVALFVTWTMVLQQDNTREAITLFGDMLIYDRYAVFAKTLALMGAGFAIFMGVRDLGAHVIGRFEYVVLVLLSTLGMMVMIAANNMLTLYMGLELQSLALYILASFNRNSLTSSEAGLKYFILGALSSGMLLFGMSLVYGYAGTTSFTAISDVILMGENAAIPMVMTVALVFILVGIAFKISAVPFHMWTPDVYQGSPNAVTAFFAMAPKMAAMAVLGRLLFSTFAELQSDWVQIIYALSLASMIVGAFAGLVQNNLYRLLAYSSIGHMGYALLGYVAGGVGGLSATLVYLALYLVMTAGTFAMILSVRNKDNIAAMELRDFAGLSQKSPLLAYGLSIMLFSMAGIPPLAGFFGKLIVFKALLAEGYLTLAIIGVVASVIAAYYYLRLIKIMFFDEPVAGNQYKVVYSRLLRWVSVPACLFVVLYIFWPDWLVYEANQAALSL